MIEVETKWQRETKMNGHALKLRPADFSAEFVGAAPQTGQSFTWLHVRRKTCPLIRDPSLDLMRFEVKRDARFLSA
jgi:hypothetical protein